MDRGIHLHGLLTLSKSFSQSSASNPVFSMPGGANKEVAPCQDKGQCRLRWKARRGRPMCRMFLERNNGWRLAKYMDMPKRRILTCPGMYHVHTPSSPLFKAQ
jgi:hypothetical protein